MGAIERNDARIVGTGSRTLVLAHGFGTNQTVWRHQVAELSSECRIARFDHVGSVGADLSAYSPHRYRSLHSFAADMLELFAELDVKGLYHVGHSMSGMIGLLAALEEPERFTRMAFIAGSPRYLNDVGYEGGFEQSDMDALHEAMASNYHAWASGFAPIAAGNPDEPEVAREFTGGLSELRPDIGLTMSRLIYQSDHRAELDAPACPTLVVQSQQDIAVPVEVGESMSRRLPNARMVPLDATGHLPHLSAPAAVNAALRSFLD